MIDQLPVPFVVIECNFTGFKILFGTLGLSRKRRGKTGFSTDARVLQAQVQLAAVDVLKKFVILPPAPPPPTGVVPDPAVPPPRERCALASTVAVGKKPARACATTHSAWRNAASAACRF